MFIFIICLLGMPIVAYVLGAKLIALTFVVFYICFGAIEIISKIKLGKTVTQDTQLLTKGKLIILTIAMVIGWGALIIHLWGIL